MALFYNTNGTVSNIVINAIIDGKVTSSIETAATIQQAFEASASNAIINKATSAGSSSMQAYQLGYPSGSTNNAGYTYLSSTTVSRQLGKYTQNGVLVSGSNQAIEAKYPTTKNDWINGVSPKRK